MSKITVQTLGGVVIFHYSIVFSKIETVFTKNAFPMGVVHFAIFGSVRNLQSS